MLIRVTAEDLKHGTLMDCHRCPVALALNRATGKRWVVTSGYCRPAGYSHLGSCLFPPFVRDKIERLDAGEQIEPFEFELAV